MDPFTEGTTVYFKTLGGDTMWGTIIGPIPDKPGFYRLKDEDGDIRTFKGEHLTVVPEKIPQIENPIPENSLRENLLNQAIQIITNDRNNSYGEPDQDFTRIAQLWNTYLQGRENIESHDVAVMMILLKVSRLSWNPGHKDSWLDIAGYAACGFETNVHQGF